MRKTVMCADRDAETVLGPEADGQRLDRALERLLPHLGLRARRRLWDGGAVLVNGRPRPAGYTVRAGDAVRVTRRENAPLSPETAAATGAMGGAMTLTPDDATPGATGGTTGGTAKGALDDASGVAHDPPRWLAAHGNLLFFHKPASLHTAALADRGGPSLEALLPRLLPAVHAGADASPPVLCNRLDMGTSGIVTAARDAAAVEDWRRTEAAGLCVKHYVALLCGHLRETLTVPNALDTRKRRVTRVLAAVAPPLRHTRFAPLTLTRAGTLAEQAARILAGKDAPIPRWLAALRACDAGLPLTLAACRIHKGARHQIRAHAAHAGYPLWGDALYGAPPIGMFLLHHGQLTLPGAVVRSPCPWRALLPNGEGDALCPEDNCLP